MTEAASAPAALIERRGNVLLITINRPEARNAVNAAVSTAVGDALQGAQDDPEVRAVVITGAGECFCAGADLKAISRRENLFHPDHGDWGFAGYVQHYIDKPTIAAVNGTAFGGGTELALASDLVIAEERTRFGLPEVKRGLIAAAGGAFRIVDHLPRKVAMELLFTGEPMSSADALKWGMINQVVPDGTALGGGSELALASDLVVAEERAKFGLPEVKRGLIAAAGGVFRIVDHLPRKVAMELIFTGEPMSSADALKWGLINQVVPDGTELDAALRLAERITVNAPLAVQASKRVAVGVDDGVITGDEPGWARTMREIGTLIRSEDAREGPLAFAEKRQPVWKAQ